VDGLNLFRMCRNNPVTHTDPDGRMTDMEDELEELALTLLTANINRAGLHFSEYKALHALASEKDWHINVRTGDESRLDWVGKKGVRPKPAGIYQKTNKAGSFKGLVLYGINEMQKMENDIHAINTPGESASASIRALAKEGYHAHILTPDQIALTDRFDNALYADIDIHSVLQGNGVPVAPELWVASVNSALERTGLHKPGNLLGWGRHSVVKEYGVYAHSPVQHGAHDEWSERNNETYAGGINMGPLPGVLNIRRSSSISDYELFNTQQYRKYLCKFSATGDSVYTENSWRAGGQRIKKVERLNIPGIISGVRKRALKRLNQH